MKPSPEKIFWFLVGNCATIMIYVFAVTFLPIHEGNARFVDTAFGFLLGSYNMGLAFYAGGTPEKKPHESGTATAEFSATITNENQSDK